MHDLKTRNVFVDTEFFDSIKLNLRNKTAQALREHAEHARIKLFLTTITVGEIRRHLRDYVSQAVTSLKNIPSKWAFLSSLKSHPLQVLFNKIEEKDLIALMESEFDSYLKEAKAEVLDLSLAQATPIFDAYFNLAPPFKEGRKKHEFPDAFAIQVLENWCNENQEQMYVVSKDEDWERACSKSNNLIYVDEIEKVLDAVTKDQERQLTEDATDYMEQNTDEIKREIRERFVDRGFYVEGEDGEVTGVMVKDIILGDPSVIAIGDYEIIVLIEATVEFKAEISINDVNSGSYDKEDSRWLYLPTRSGIVEDEQYLRAVVTLDYDPKEHDFLGLSVDLEDVSETINVAEHQWQSWPIDEDVDAEDDFAQ